MTTETTINRILAMREAGEVKRCHTIPHIGEYNLAIHSYNMLCLLYELMPSAPSNALVQAILVHDLPERWTGDIPSPTKNTNPLLKKVVGDVEDKIFKRLGFRQHLLTENETNWLHAVDLLELLLWVKQQKQMGNQLIFPMHTKIMNMFLEKRAKVPTEVIRFIEDFNWKRLPEADELLE